MEGGWIGVDLDGTLAAYFGWQGEDHIGPPVPLMRDRVKRWRADGIEVRIVTARVSHPDAADAARATIEAWCLQHLGEVLPVTAQKDFRMIELWDDRVVSVEKNTGRIISRTIGGPRGDE